MHSLDCIKASSFLLRTFVVGLARITAELERHIPGRYHTGDNVAQPL
jgi:hypothetical protein